MKFTIYNGEHYVSPTEYEAIRNVDRERKLYPKATAEQRVRDRRCWECLNCNYCKSAFKMTTLCEFFRQRKRRKPANA